jgi:16S rRNA (cytosine1402-N4)-methyltransferase
MQLDEAERGFSFMRDGPLDMRMSQDGVSAADLLNEAAPELLSDVIAVYGEERRARAIVKAIMARRDTQPLATHRRFGRCGVFGFGDDHVSAKRIRRRALFRLCGFI